MRAGPILVLILALPTLIPSAAAAEPAAFAATSPACVPTEEARDLVREHGTWACSVEHAGTVGAPTCSGGTCAISITTDARADAVGWNDKKLEHTLQVTLGPKQTTSMLCSAVGVGAHLACARQTVLTLALPADGCATLTFTSRYVEKVLALPTIGTTATSTVTVCNA